MEGFLYRTGAEAQVLVTCVVGKFGPRTKNALDSNADATLQIVECKICAPANPLY